MPLTNRSRTSVYARLAAGTAAALWLLGPGPAPRLGAQTPSFRTGITVVPIDVRVVDRKGNSINDLTRSDFIIKEDGVRQEITHFARISMAPTTAAQPEILAPCAS